jgi:chloramphenicol O-acetyltransferase type A
MPEYLDLEKWSRRAQFEFFKTYDNPFFNITASVDVTSLLDLTRADKGISFFIAYHFLSIKAANEVENFRYRLDGERVRIYERIHAGTIVLLPNESFTFVYFDYQTNYGEFQTRARVAVDRALVGEPDLEQRADREDLIHHSVLPWIAFTSISHARKFKQPDSVPKIAFGKYTTENGRTRMPVSVEVHHALMDGLHVARYFEKFQGYLDDPRSALELSDKL